MTSRAKAPFGASAAASCDAICMPPWLKRRPTRLRGPVWGAIGRGSRAQRVRTPDGPVGTGASGGLGHQLGAGLGRRRGLDGGHLVGAAPGHGGPDALVAIEQDD